MLDTHEKITGIMPHIFGISTYSFFVGLGIAAGVIYYFIDAKKRGAKGEGVIVIAASALIFGMIGSKIPLLFEGRTFEEILVGKSIVGGLIGGMSGVICIKKIFGIRIKMGNIIAPAAALGMAIGRLGCFFNGCCYGKLSTWGFNFGDGNARLPTQLFESLFHLMAFSMLSHYKDKIKTPGILFKIYLLAYFVFRFFQEFIRQNPVIWAEMSIYQLICVVGIVYMSIVLWYRKSH